MQRAENGSGRACRLPDVGEPMPRTAPRHSGATHSEGYLRVPASETEGLVGSPCAGAGRSWALVRLLPFCLLAIACGPGGGAKDPCAACPVAPPSHLDATVVLDLAKTPLAADPSEPALDVTSVDGQVTWSGDEAFLAERYLVVVDAGDGTDRVAGEPTAPPFGLADGLTLLGLQPVRGGRYGRLQRPPALEALRRRHTRAFHRPLPPSPSPHPTAVDGGWQQGAIEAELTLAPPGLSGRATSTLRAGASPEFRLALHPGAALVSVTDRAGRTATTEQQGAVVTVTLDPAPAPGDEVILDLVYEIADVTLSLEAYGEVARVEATRFYFTGDVAVFPRLEGADPASVPVVLRLVHDPALTVVSGDAVNTVAPGTTEIVASPVRRSTWPGAAGATVSPARSEDGRIVLLAAEGAQYLGYAASTFEFFTRRYGTPAVDSVAVVAVGEESYGRAQRGLIFVPESWVGPEVQDDGLFLLAHELSHQWLGVTVALRSPLDLWLVEGGADYWGLSAFADYAGPQRAEALWQGERDLLLGWIEAQGDAPLRPERAADLKTYVFYLKGALVLRHLEGLLGVDALVEVYRQWIANGVGDTADFVAEAEAAAGGEMGWFFDPWLGGLGLPRIDFVPYFGEATGDVELVVTLSGQSAWRVPVGTASGWGCAELGTMAVLPRAPSPWEACRGP
ncbi:MAG: hypothetical protein D6729_10090 [Deltaproteobacteria bacterium]|nr:MAG: hypothetical protein D6729_10090 [Deltaproteobacteria bacterium]